MTLVDTSAWVEALRSDGSEAVRRRERTGPGCCTPIGTST